MVDSAARNYSSKKRFSMGKTQVFMLLRLQLESGKIPTQMYTKVPLVGLKSAKKLRSKNPVSKINIQRKLFSTSSGDTLV